VSGRFSLSFPGRRGHDDPWFRIGTIDVNTSLLVALLCAVSLFVWAASPDTLSHVALIPSEVTSGQVWRVLTWPLFNKPDIWTVLNIVMMWYFGKELERMVGRTKFAVLLVLLAVVPGLVALPLDTILFGVRPLEIAVFCLFVAEFPNVRFFFGIQAWILGAVIVGIEVLQDVGNRQYELLLILAASLATAALAGKAFGLLSEVTFIPKLGGGSSSPGRTGSRPVARSSAPRQATRGKGRDFDRVVAGPWNDSANDDHAEMDRLLDKMNSVGLSDAERRRLTELGRKLRGS
jgi:membrane associated rhomboid family serine protease